MASESLDERPTDESRTDGSSVGGKEKRFYYLATSRRSWRRWRPPTWSVYGMSRQIAPRIAPRPAAHCRLRSNHAKNRLSIQLLSSERVMPCVCSACLHTRLYIFLYTVESKHMSSCTHKSRAHRHTCSTCLHRIALHATSFGATEALAPSK